MTVGELINELSKFPEHLNIEVDDGNGDFEIKSIDKTVCSITIKPVF